jgi:hypothetical protein
MNSRVRFTKLLGVANVAFWLAFGALFVAKSYPYKPHKPVFEEVTPSYIFFGRALRQIDTGTGVGLPPPLINLTFAIQRLSVLAARPFYWYFDSRGVTVDHLYGGISVGGYYLSLVCVVSFLQWSLVGLLIDYLARRRNGKPTLRGATTTLRTRQGD